MGSRFTQVVLAMGAAIMLSGCKVSTHASNHFQHLTHTIEMDKSEMARVRVHMRAGELRIRGGSKDLLYGDFTYTSPDWKPEFHTQTSGFRSQIEVNQPVGSTIFGDHK